MPLWRVPGVDAEPEIILDAWQICKSNEDTYHFTGYHMGGGRCSSKIVSFNLKELTGKTRSGRIYKLVEGRRGWNGDAAARASNWARFNDMTFEAVAPEDVKLPC